MCIDEILEISFSTTNQTWHKASLCEIDPSSSKQDHLTRNRTPPLCDVLPFEINNENHVILIIFICTNLITFLLALNQQATSSVSQLIGRPAICGSRVRTLHLLWNYKCIFGAIVIDFDIFTTLVVIRLQNCFILVNTRCPRQLNGHLSIKRFYTDILPEGLTLANVFIKPS